MKLLLLLSWVTPSNMTSFVVDTSEGAWARHLCADTATAHQRILSTRPHRLKLNFGLPIPIDHHINAKPPRLTIGGTFPITMSEMPFTALILDRITTTFTLRHQEKVST